MSSTEEYQQQNAWNDFINEAQKEFINKKLKDEFKKSFYDELVLGESMLHISKDSVKRIDPLSPEYEKLHDIIQQRLEEGLIKHIDPNKSYLPKGYESKK